MFCAKEQKARENGKNKFSFVGEREKLTANREPPLPKQRGNIPPALATRGAKRRETRDKKTPPRSWSPVTGDILLSIFSFLFFCHGDTPKNVAFSSCWPPWQVFLSSGFSFSSSHKANVAPPRLPLGEESTVRSLVGKPSVVGLSLNRFVEFDMEGIPTAPAATVDRKRAPSLCLVHTLFGLPSLGYYARRGGECRQSQGGMGT